MNCEICGTQLQALFTSNYCPNDCDKKPAKVSAIAHPDTCVAIVEVQPTNHKKFTRPTTAPHLADFAKAMEKLVSDYYKGIIDYEAFVHFTAWAKQGYALKTSYQVHPLKEMTYKRLEQPNKETKFVTLKQVNSKMFQDFSDLFTNKQVAPASGEQNVEQQTKKENL